MKTGVPKDMECNDQNSDTMVASRKIIYSLLEKFPGENPDDKIKISNILICALISFRNMSVDETSYDVFNKLVNDTLKANT
jgi:hypothetical protein